MNLDEIQKLVASIFGVVLSGGAVFKLIVYPLMQMKQMKKNTETNKCQNKELQVIMTALQNIALSMKAQGYNHTIDKTICALQDHLNAAAHKN